MTMYVIWMQQQIWQINVNEMDCGLNDMNWNMIYEVWTEENEIKYKQWSVEMRWNMNNGVENVTSPYFCEFKNFTRRSKINVTHSLFVCLFRKQLNLLINYSNFFYLKLKTYNLNFKTIQYSSTIPNTYLVS